ncbi:MAG TPA: hypothetical protein VLQ48_07785 [Chloroflexia bacterium]|nr:hypothetical protein [Chloroflexia bacterium]
MDKTTTPDEGASGRSAEEMEWDAEFADMSEPKAGGAVGNMSDLAGALLKLPAALIKLPMTLLPDDTAKHARGALREGFLAVRSLVDAVNDNIENMLTEGGSAKPAVKGPQGTWGSGTQVTGSLLPGKVNRIQVEDEVEEMGGGDGSGKHITIDDLGANQAENTEGRGMRADIDY